MNTNPDDWWLRRRHPPVGPGDAWSGGGKAYRAWMARKPRRDPPGPSGAGQERGGPTNPRAAIRYFRAPRFMRVRRLQHAERPSRSAAGILLSILTGMPFPWLGSGKRLRLLLGLGAAGLAAVIFLAPLAWAGRWHPCAAAEVALVDEAVGLGSRFEGSKRRVANWAGPDGKLVSNGRVGRQIASEEHPGWPPFAGCTALFWRARSDAASFGGFTAVLLRALSVPR